MACGRPLKGHRKPRWEVEELDSCSEESFATLSSLLSPHCCTFGAPPGLVYGRLKQRCSLDDTGVSASHWIRQPGWLLDVCVDASEWPIGVSC